MKEISGVFIIERVGLGDPITGLINQERQNAQTGEKRKSGLIEKETKISNKILS